MKAVVDLDVCQGYGTCVEVMPELFRLDEWGYAYVEGDGEVPAGHESLATEAAHGCPMTAISFAD